MVDLSLHIPANREKARRYRDRLATVGVTAGGAAVLLAILLIFFYLLYEVLPLFGGTSVADNTPDTWQGGAPPAYLSLEEQGEVGLAVSAGGEAIFFRVADGRIISRRELGAGRAPVTVLAGAAAGGRTLALGHADGSVNLLRSDYRLGYPEGRRVITPSLRSLYPDRELRLGTGAVAALAVQDSEDGLLLVAELAGEGLRGLRFRRQQNPLTGESSLEPSTLRLPALPGQSAALYLGAGQRWLYRLDQDGGYVVLDLQSGEDAGVATIVDQGRLFENGAALATSAMLLGDISLLAASEAGKLHQYFMVRDGRGGHQLQRVRSFDTGGVVVRQLVPEQRRKGFVALGRSGELQIFHTTAHRRLYVQATGMDLAGQAAISPRGDTLIAVDTANTLHSWAVDNEHPDISWSALWQKVWYESHDEPAHIWQSSAANNDFEPKYSLAPLAFGTLKAAFYTMLIAAPLAICGAIYTAYFMAPTLRRKVKPLIELMEALPTVILGFLAGLWLAPIVEDRLAGIFSFLVLMPIGILLFAYLFSHLPLAIRRRVPDGWDAALLIPVVVLIGYLGFALNGPLEQLLFGGDMRLWIGRELGVSFDQRNSLVVGIAMGMAVIPTIFSIAEDAIFSVPGHLSDGSLALGATPWQTLTGVVLPTASPGIFSGLMIGLGRAVGETMIVLMATGNTPIMDANIFEGMRTLSANIAIEMPEAEVNSTHYRILFLAAFVLFLFTFVVNTIAELIRQRLRSRYGSL
ncbi:ABC transporter permease subunit [Parahaliea maris]|uniref:ABC transporter permease subunit n=1 Tax=Parahaliea maris TaxID=2716870 RepID=A0A5C9A8Q0_9GAMM|nr:ABC transporter permease subunit [Parahaliea maris]TXS95601.1 ABC transporter permease subunit [Parahaliea maris]